MFQCYNIIMHLQIWPICLLQDFKTIRRKNKGRNHMANFAIDNKFYFSTCINQQTIMLWNKNVRNLLSPCYIKVSYIIIKAEQFALKQWHMLRNQYKKIKHCKIVFRFSFCTIAMIIKPIPPPSHNTHKIKSARKTVDHNITKIHATCHIEICTQESCSLTWFSNMEEM